MTATSYAAVVVDDEPLARQRILRLLARDADFRVVGECSSASQALQLNVTEAPDLILLDISMPNEDGFELLRRWGERGFEPFVIFVTAYSEHAIKAFEVDAVDYLLKPFDDERFMKALARAKTVIGTERTGAPPVADPEEGAARAPDPSNLSYPQRLLIAEAGKVMFMPTREVEFVQSAGKHVKVFAQGKCHLLRQPMHELEARLDPNQFVRIHRSSIVNVDQIVEMHPLFHGDYELVLKRGTRLAMSRRFRGRFGRFLAGK
ncbi:MAG: LytTR family DNA-binding domain-containing protein [Steroidobacteraceae bacterium]